MKKEKLVTRTIDFTFLDSFVFDIEKEETKKDTFALIGKYDEDTISKAFDDEFEGRYKLLKVNSLSYDSKLIGQTETQFYRNGTILPNRKVYNKEEE